MWMVKHKTNWLTFSWHEYFFHLFTDNCINQKFSIRKPQMDDTNCKIFRELKHELHHLDTPCTFFVCTIWYNKINVHTLKWNGHFIHLYPALYSRKTGFEVNGLLWSYRCDFHHFIRMSGFLLWSISRRRTHFSHALCDQFMYSIGPSSLPTTTSPH